MGSLLGIFLRLAASIYLCDSADLLFAGDAMQHSAQIDAARRTDGTYDYSPSFVEIADVVKEADYAIVNLETPLGGRPYRGYPCFSAPDSYAEALREAGFDLMLTANNHTLDCRDRGLRRTVAALDSLGIPHIGTYTNPAARETALPFIADINGFKTAFLNYTYGTNGIEKQSDVVVDYIDRELIADDIRRARQAGAEIVCVAVHWGEEYQLVHNRRQTDLANFLERQGVDIIFGGHPHVIQPMEMRVDSVSGHRTALIYSLGNFVSNMRTRDTRGGAIADVRLRRDSVGRAYVDRLSYRLIFTDPPTSATPAFTVRLANDSVSPAMRSHRDQFVRAALDIFRRHNKGVGHTPVRRP